MKPISRKPIFFPILIFLIITSSFSLGIGIKSLIEDSRTDLSRNVRMTNGASSAPIVRATEIKTDTEFGLLDEIYSILDNEFIDPSKINLDDIRRSAINGVVNSLNDPHSIFIDQEVFRLSSEAISGEFEGIGATVNLEDNEIVIAGTFYGSPAEGAGIRTGDVILEVDGESTNDWSLQYAVARIRGAKGSVVELLVRHRNDVEELISVKRDKIIIPSVLTLDINDRNGEPVLDIGYVILSQFTDRTQEEIVDFIKSVSSLGLTKLIIDLRGNPGGLLTATIDTTGEFIDGGLILTEVDRSGDQRNYEDLNGGHGIDFDIAILVNGGSASGSEVMAAAMRDYDRAVIIGEQTFGKGTVSAPRILSDGSVLYVSIARWLSPKGELLEGVGVIPDIIIEPSDEDFELQRDVQLFAAIEALRNN